MIDDVTTSGRRGKDDPLEPLIAVTRVLGMIIALFVVAGVLATLFDRGEMLTIGADTICTTVEAGLDVPASEVDVTGWGAARGVSAETESYRLCQTHPSVAAHLFAVAENHASDVLLIGFLAGVHLLVRRARRAGLFSLPVTRVAHWLGWWVLGGELVVVMVQAFAHSALVQQMIDRDDSFLAASWDVNFAVLIAGAGILTTARVLRLSVMMREDLDGTI